MAAMAAFFMPLRPFGGKRATLLLLRRNNGGGGGKSDALFGVYGGHSQNPGNKCVPRRAKNLHGMPAPALGRRTLPSFLFTTQRSLHTAPLRSLARLRPFHFLVATSGGYAGYRQYEKYKEKQLENSGVEIPPKIASDWEVSHGGFFNYVFFVIPAPLLILGRKSRFGSWKLASWFGLSLNSSRMAAQV